MEVTLPYLIFHFEPHFEHRDAWVGGGELVKEVDFAFMLCFCIYALLLFCASPFCNVQWLAGSLFYKAVILYSLLFQNLDPFFAIKLFVVLPNLWFEKLKLCPIILMLDWFHA